MSGVHPSCAAFSDGIVREVDSLLQAEPEVAALLNLPHGRYDTFPALAGALLGRIGGGNPSLARIVEDVYAATPDLVAMSDHDIAETARRNFEPGGRAASLLFSRGVHAVMAHRVAHALWQRGETTLALAVKSTLGAALSTDIHPAARFGRGLWLDHGLGFVVGETAVIGEDVSIWHNVTLGSTLSDSGPTRHPRIGQGAVIGAGAILLGDITIGAGATIAAGAIVLDDVPASTIMAGSKAWQRGAARVSFVQGTEERS